MSEKIKVSLPVIVEGKYDKIKLASVLDANIITTDGFGIFNNKEKLALIRRLARTGDAAPHNAAGIIVATDSDGAGLIIRNFFRGALPAHLVHHVYIPAIKGKERRKSAPSKEGLLGVEGMDADLLRAAFEPYRTDREPPAISRTLTKTDFYTLGLSGGDGSAEARLNLCKALALPLNMSANALLAAVNMLGLADETETFCRKYKKEG